MSPRAFALFLLLAFAAGAKALHERCSEYFRSQYNQDRILFELLRRRVDIEPLYIDLAANHYYSISNTYALDLCLGWKGLCIEPDADRYYFGLLKHRSCDIFPTCISNQEETVSFLTVGPLGGILDTNKNVNSTADWTAHVTAESPKKEMTCVTMEFLLQRQRIRRVGFFSLDVEGHELHILQGINWNEVEIDVIALENNKLAIEYLLEKGYRQYEGEIYVSERIHKLLH